MSISTIRKTLKVIQPKYSDRLFNAFAIYIQYMALLESKLITVEHYHAPLQGSPFVAIDGRRWFSGGLLLS